MHTTYRPLQSGPCIHYYKVYTRRLHHYYMHYVHINVSGLVLAHLHTTPNIIPGHYMYYTIPAHIALSLPFTLRSRHLPLALCISLLGRQTLTRTHLHTLSPPTAHLVSASGRLNDLVQGDGIVSALPREPSRVTRHSPCDDL